MDRESGVLEPSAKPERGGTQVDEMGITLALAVRSQQVVHSARTEEAEVAEALANLGGTEWTSIRMRL
jgi:hypothetical protein